MTKRALKREVEDLLAKAEETLTDAERDRLAETLDSDELAPSTDGYDGEITIEWADAKPADRPAGIQWDPETATLTYDLWAAQRSCLDRLTDDDADLVGFVAGYGSGKSILGARWLLAQAIAHPGSRFLAMGIDFTKARDATFRILFEQLPGQQTGVRTSGQTGPEQSPLVDTYTHTDHRLVLANGSTIVLGSGDEWNRHAGDEFGAIWLDEPSHYDANLHKLLEMLGGRLRGVAGPKVQCWTLTGNGYDDAWEILVQRQDETGDPIGLTIDCVRAATLENPYLDQGTRERFTRQYEGSRREAQALEGAFTEPEGRVYDGFRRERHVISAAEARDRVDSDWRLYGYDAGWKNPRVVVELGMASGGQLVVVDEFYERKSHIEDVIEWLETEAKPRGKIYAEHEPSELNKMARTGHRVRDADKGLDAGIADVRRRLETDPEGIVGLVISHDCPRLIREFLGYREEDVGTSGADDHCLDALRYAVHGRDGGDRIDKWSETTDESVPKEPVVTGQVGGGYFS